MKQTLFIVLKISAAHEISRGYSSVNKEVLSLPYVMSNKVRQCSLGVCLIWMGWVGSRGRGVVRNCLQTALQSYD